MATVLNDEVSGYRGGVINVADAFLLAKMGSNVNAASWLLKVTAVSLENKGIYLWFQEQQRPPLQQW